MASSSKGSAKPKSFEGFSSSKGSAYPRCIDMSFLQGVRCWKFEQQRSTIPVVSGRIVAFDWHQVTDTYTVHPDIRRFVLIGRQVSCFNQILMSICRLLTALDSLTKSLSCPTLKRARKSVVCLQVHSGESLACGFGFRRRSQNWTLGSGSCIAGAFWRSKCVELGEANMQQIADFEQSRQNVKGRFPIQNKARAFFLSRI